MKCVAPMRTSSSTAIEAEGPPMPVEQTLIGVPRSVSPVKITYSRLRATSRAFTNRWAILSALPGSPGIST